MKQHSTLYNLGVVDILVNAARWMTCAACVPRAYFVSLVRVLGVVGQFLNEIDLQNGGTKSNLENITFVFLFCEKKWAVINFIIKYPSPLTNSVII